MTDLPELLAISAAIASPPASADARLIDGVARRDADALSRFYEEHVDGLYAFVFYRVRRDATLAEDAVQDTFVEAFRHLDAYDPTRGSLRAWLLTLSLNVVRKHLRDHPRRRELGAWQADLDSTLGDWLAVLRGEPASDELLEREQTRALVTLTIANLPDRYRDVLLRKYVEGETMDQIATELELSAQASKSLLARARGAFRQAFVELSADEATRHHR